jgi:DNA-binding MurR/RpiR family transcriptional regulator
MSSLTSKQTNSIPASEFHSWVRGAPDTQNVPVAISQSRESVDVLSEVSSAKKMGIRSVAVTNTPGNTLSKFADFEAFLENERALKNGCCTHCGVSTTSKLVRESHPPHQFTNRHEWSGTCASIVF